MNMRAVVGLSLWSCCIGLSVGGVLFDAEHDALRITDYPLEAPCTPARLAAFDRAFGWGKVHYDPAADTYAIACHLAIGANDGTETYFQIGSTNHPAETLVMNGNIYVQPYWIEDDNTEARWWHAPPRVNRLTLGCADNTNVHAVLKFAPENSLLAGRVAPGREVHGGQICVYNSRITALDPQTGFGIKIGANRYGSLSQVSGDGHVFVNAHIAHARGQICYGMDPGGKKAFRVENTTFSDFGFMSPTAGTYVNCVFEGAKEVAFRDFGGLNAELTDCVFKNNERNWELVNGGKGLTLIDCTWKKPRTGDVCRAWTNKEGKKHYPAITSQRHMIIEVVSPDGKPVPGAQIIVRCEQGLSEMVDNAKQTTDAVGRTPCKGGANPLLLMETTQKTTDIPNQPEVKEYSYTIAVEAEGHAPVSVTGIMPVESWKVVRVQIK